MPPIQIVDVVDGIISGNDRMFPGPMISKAGDTHLAIIGRSADFDMSVDDTDPSWEQVAKFSHSVFEDPTVIVCRRRATDGAIPPIVISSIGAWELGRLLVIRGANPSSPIVASGVANVAASANFVCPSLALVSYSDLYIGIVGAQDDRTFTPPAGTTELFDVPDSGVPNHGIAAFAYLKESTGASGTKTAVASGAATGWAGALLLAADAIVGFGKSFSFDPIGAIGLPRRGI